MTRYIDADALYTRVKTHTNPYGNPTLDYESGVKVLRMIEQEQTADVVEVVRCKDCVASRPLRRNDRFEAQYHDGCIYCTRTDEGVEQNDFCSYGERSDT